MDSLASVSPSMVLSSTVTLSIYGFVSPLLSAYANTVFSLVSPLLPASYSSVPSSGKRLRWVSCKFSNHGSKYPEEQEDEDGGQEEVERALCLDSTIPGTSNEFVKQVSSCAYDIRRNLQ